MAYITKKKPSPVGDKPKEDKIEKPTNKWIQKKTKWIQKKKKKKHIKPIDKVDLGKDLLPKTKIETIREPREPFATPGPKSMKPLKAGGRAKHNIGGRANLLEEMGRIDARRHPDAADRAEKRRVIGELNRGYNKGGLVIKGKPKLAKKGWK